MKPKFKHTLVLAALAAISHLGTAHASTVLLTDNFSTNNNAASTFNNNLAADQGGTLATVSYTVTTGGQEWHAQHSNGGAMLLVSDWYIWAGGYASTASLNHNFAPNAASGPLSISFDARWADGQDQASDWFCFTVGSAQNTYVDNASVGYGVLFNWDGATQHFQGGSGIGSTGANTWSSNTSAFKTVTIVLSDGVGGSAFDGNGSVADLYSGNTLISSINLTTQLTSSDGYMTFAAGPYNGDYAVVSFDNLSIAVIPEPSTALLGGLGMLALLRRRRA